MEMEMLKNMKTSLMSQVQTQMGHLDTVDAKELGEAVDMIKDLSEAIYYCTITEAMKTKEKEEPHTMYYIPYYRDIERPNGKMYYGGRMYYTDSSTGSTTGNGSTSGSYSDTSGTKNYREYEYRPYEMRDMREGRSPQSRKTYMESKEMHHDKSKQLKELEKYMQELTTDIVEMIEDATPEEKQILHSKLQTLAQKVI